jgi:hypothetical protein
MRGRNSISSEGGGCRVPMVVAMGRTSARGTAVVRFDAPAGPRSVPPAPRGQLWEWRVVGIGAPCSTKPQGAVRVTGR